MPLRHNSRVTSWIIALGCVSLMLVSGATIVASTGLMVSHTEKRVIARVSRNMQIAWRVLHELGAMPRIENGELYVGATPLNGNVAFIDDLHDLLGGVATVFQGDVRVTTNVPGPNSARGIGTRLSDPAVRDTVLRDHKPFRGIVDILGQPYYSAYDAIFDQQGRLIGILYVGVSVAEVVADVRHTRLTVLWVSGSTMLLVGLLFLGVGRRLAAQIEARERSLRVTNRRFDAALANMGQGLCLWDSQDRLELANRRFCELFNISPRSLRDGMTMRDLLAVRPHDIDQANFGEMLHRQRVALAEGVASGFIERLTGGRTIHVQLRPMLDGGWVATYEDITERREVESRVAFLARHDALTGLANRSLFRERLDRALAEAAPVAVLYLDLDRFKDVNDTLGHQAGDALLVAAAARMRGCVRESDTVARLGGDEFAIVQPLTRSQSDVEQIAQRIADSVGAPYTIGGKTVAIATSIGIALADGEDAEEVLRHADLALYCAKADRRGAWRVFEPGMELALQRRRQLEADLRQAVGEDRFELHYQPLVHVQTGTVTGFEALMRWRHPERGLVPPDEFIPAAEEMGLIVPMGAWALRRACAEAATWPDHIKVAVNLSPVQFRTDDLVRTVAEALALSGIAPARLEVEITETVLLRETSANSAMLHELRELGVRIVLDDFGIGYSSLSYLRAFPFDKIKIDRSFVAQLGRRKDCDAIVRAVSGLAQALGIETTGEGVETPGQLDYLRAQGCSEAQGYLFSRPQPADEVARIIARIDGAAPSGRPMSRANAPDLLAASLP